MFAYLSIAFGLFSLFFMAYDTARWTNEYMEQMQQEGAAYQSTSTVDRNLPQTGLPQSETDQNVIQDSMKKWTLTAVLGFIISLVSFLFQVFVNYQWSESLNRNITETNQILGDIIEKTSDEEAIYDFEWMGDKLNSMRIQPWPFYIYVAMSVFSIFLNEMSFFFSIFSFAFLAYYLSKIFKVCYDLVDIKSQFYAFYLKETYVGDIEYIIPYRNILLFFFFTIVTFGIYWYYLLFKLSMEINQFLDADERLRKKLPESPVLEEEQ